MTDHSIAGPQFPLEPPDDPAGCPIGVCDGSGLLVTTDMTGQTTEPCVCAAAPRPELRDQVLAEIRWCAGTERLLAALAEPEVA